MNLSQWFTESGWLDGGRPVWVVEVFLAVFITLLLALVVRKVLVKLVSHAERTTNLWDDALLEAAVRPINWFIWVIGLTWAAEMTGHESGAVIFKVVEPVRNVAVISLLCWFLVGFIRQAEQNLMDPKYRSKPVDATTLRAIGKLMRISVIITGALVTLQTLGYSVSGVLAFGGIGGLAIGFAAKDLLANFFGGLMIYLDRPFSVGDWIRSPDKEIEGTVEDIGWRLTRIRTFDKRPLYIPNGTFAQISVENPSRMSNRRIYETVGIRYDDASKMREIVDDVKSMLRNHPEIDAGQTLIVNFNAYSASSLDFFVYTFTKTTDWVRYHEIKQDIMLNILELIERRGAECAFPTSTLHVPEALSVQSCQQ